MTDVHSPEVRSYNMSKIRGKDTKTGNACQEVSVF